ncbi:MAG: SRPBCC family protein [Chitinophagaceae bacterium]|nr:SRPBCC family protein [Chitinophagaceae bacterium]
MNILLTIILAIALLIALLLLIALFTKNEYNVQREIIIAAPGQKVFDYVKHIRNQDHYNKWVMADPGMKKEFRGTDGQPGFVYAWNGNKKAGEGEQEIKAIEEGKKITTEIRFIRPFPGAAHAIMETTPLPGGRTNVKWSTGSKLKYPMNIMIAIIHKMLSKDMGTSLSTLKTILEK